MQKLPTPWVGRMRTPAGIDARPRSVANWAAVSSSTWRFPEQVGPADAPGEEAAAGQDGDRRRPVLDDVPREVLRGVPGGRPSDEPKPSDTHLVRIVDGAMVEGVAATGRGRDRRARPGTDLEGTRQIVVVDVGLEDADDPPAASLGRIDEPVDVALRVDDHGLVGRPDQVGRVAQAAGDEGLEVHPVESATVAPSPPVGPGRCAVGDQPRRKAGRTSAP